MLQILTLLLTNQRYLSGSLCFSLLLHVFEDTWLTSCCCLVDKLRPTLATPWTIAGQAPLSMGFLRQEYWGGLPFPSPRDLPDPRIEPTSPSLAGRFTMEAASCGYRLTILILLFTYIGTEQLRKWMANSGS